MPESAIPTGDALDMDAAAEALANLREPGTQEEEPEEELAPEEGQEPAGEEEQAEEPEGSEVEDGEQEETETEPDDAAPDLEAIAKTLRLDPQDLSISEDGTLMVKTKVDGEEGEVSLADLRKGFQLESSYTRKSMEFAEQRKAHEQALQESQQRIQQREQQLVTSLQMAQQALDGDYAHLDWARLQQEDPTQYLMLKENYNQRQAAIQAGYTQLQQEQQQRMEQFQTQQAEYLQNEVKELQNRVPEWQNKEVAQKEYNALLNTMKTAYGMTDDELSQISSHKHVLIMRDAQKFRELQQKTPEALKKVKKAAPIARPGSGNKNQNKSKEQTARERFSQTRSDRDAADILAALREKQERA